MTDSAAGRAAFPADTDVYSYRSGAVARYAAAYAVSAVVSALLVGYCAYSAIGNPYWIFSILGVLLFAGSAVVCVAGALGARHKWGDDDRLAVAVNSEGMTLPRAGLVPWAQIDSLGVWMQSLTPSLAVYDRIRWRLFGSSPSQRIVVYVRDMTPYAARTRHVLAFTEKHPGAEVAAPRNGIGTAFGQGLEQPFADVAVPVVLAAGTRGVRIEYHLDPSFFRPSSHRAGRYGCEGCEKRWLSSGDNGTLAHLGRSQPYAVDVWRCSRCGTAWEDGAVFPRMLTPDEVASRVPGESAR